MKENLLHELKRRRLAQFATAYAAGGWVVLEAIDQLVGNGIIPGLFYPLALVLFLCCFPGVVVVSWFHGARGQQRAPRLERGLLAAIGALALVAGGLTVRGGLAEPSPRAPLDTLDPTADPRRIAVLYFEADAASEFLASGLTESLIDELSAVDALHVISRNGVALYRGQRIPSDSIGRALGVGTLVEGQVSESDSTIRVRVSLVDASGGQTLGSRRLERPRAELFELQDDLAREVALFLREAIGDEIAMIERRAGVRSVEAWELLQRAEARREEADRSAAAGDVASARAALLGADSLLLQAEELAPDWWTPITQRGWVAYQQARLGGLDRGENAAWLSRAIEHAGRTLARHPGDADALELRGTVEYWRYLINLTDGPGEARQLFEAAERDLSGSVAANPQQASALSSLSHLLMNKGAVPQAKLAAQRSYEADPYLRNANVTLWRLFSAALELQDPIEARKWCEEGRRRFEEDFRFRECQVWLFTLPGQHPDIEQAWRICGEMEALSPTGARDFYRKRCEVVVGLALVRAEMPDSARSVLVRARVSAEIDPIRELSSFEAIARAWLGDLDEAIDLYAAYLAANPGLAETCGADDSWWLEALRADPRYASLCGGR